MKSFSGKVAAITGAGSGMGRTLASALGARGCHLALSDVDEAGLSGTAALLAGRSVRVTTKKVDVGQREAVEAWAVEVVRDHGRCNLIFNNAGISHGATVEGMDYEEIQRVMQVNFWGVVHGTRAFLPHLRASGDGHVVNTSSLFGLIAFPGQSAYNASKFAVRGYTEALRLELEMTGAKVSATSVHPGGIQTNIVRASKMHPSLRDLGIQDLEAASRLAEKQFKVTAEAAAEAILRGVERNQRRVLIGHDARAFDALQRSMPGTYGKLVARFVRRVMGNA